MNVRITGVGSQLAPHVITNERITRAIPGWTPERIVEKTGIVERRFAWDFDEQTGKAKVPSDSGQPGPSVQLAEAALLAALRSAGRSASELDGLILTTCTPDIPTFSHDAMMLHKRLGMRPDAFALLHDDGCGGALFHLAMARELLLGGTRRTIAVVACNAFSPHLDRDAYSGTLRRGDKELGSFLSWYLFGDGAGAIILERGAEAGRPGASGILASYAANEQMDLVVRRGGGNLHPLYPGRGDVTDNAFYVDGLLVAQAFDPILKQAIDEALRRAEVKLGDIQRFYLHQANKRVLEAFIRRHGIPADRAPMHTERYGNLVSAGTLVLLAEDLERGVVRLGSGELVLMAALGAGAQSAAHVIRL